MRAPARIAAFAAALGLTFGAAALLGAAVDPLRDSDESHGHDAERPAVHAEGHGRSPAAGSVAEQPAGLAVAQRGYRLEPDATDLPLGRDTQLGFRILGADGVPVKDFEVEHEHLIVVRRDLTGYQHLHPTLGPDGRWAVRLRLPEAGVYRAYADFRTNGKSLTLATDLVVRGPFAPQPLPAPAPIKTTAGYKVGLAADGLVAGGDAELGYDISRDGAPVGDLEPYLGADGHLVALREGDLAFLHVHPEESATPGRIHFGASLPSEGGYRLFLQFKHDGAVRTVAHTLVVSR